MFKEHRLAYDDPSRLRAYQNFKENLADILRAARGAGIPVVLSAVGSNLKDCAPFASLHNTALSSAQQSQSEAFLQQGLSLQAAGRNQEACQAFAQAAALDPQQAELQFRLGACDLALSNDVRAAQEFQSACDDDAGAFRADARINHIIKDAAQAHAGEGLRYVDAPEMLAENSPDKIPGNELFFDHVHLNFAGNYLLGRAFADQVAAALPSPVVAKGKKDWATEEACDRRLAVSVWDRSKLAGRVLGAFDAPPFVDQSNSEARSRIYLAQLEQLEHQMDGESNKKSRAMYEEAIALAPDDYCLHDNFSEFLFHIGDVAGALKEEQRVADLLPQSPLPYQKIGRALVSECKVDEAVTNFLRALKIRPDDFRVLDQLGLIAANRQEMARAAAYFAQSLRLNPGFVDTHIDWGFAQECDGKVDQAAAQYRQAADLQPAGPAALFSQAVELARAHQRDKAINCLRDAVWMKPDFWQARYLLGVELAAAGKTQDAQGQFSEVIAARPDFAKAHLNEGVAWARQGKFEMALAEFQTAVKLNPADKVARKNLEAVQQDVARLQAARTTGQKK